MGCQARPRGTRRESRQDRAASRTAMKPSDDPAVETTMTNRLVVAIGLMVAAMIVASAVLVLAAILLSPESVAEHTRRIMMVGGAR